MNKITGFEVLGIGKHWPLEPPKMEVLDLRRNNTGPRGIQIKISGDGTSNPFVLQQDEIMRVIHALKELYPDSEDPQS